MSARRFLQQSMQGPSDPMELLELGVETQAISNEIEDLLSQAQRATDHLDALEDLRIGVEGIQNADAQHLLVIEAAINFVHAGTLNKASETIPGLESYLDGTISTEGFGAFVVQVAKSIYELLVRLWERINLIFDTVNVDARLLRYSLLRLRNRAAEIAGESPIKPHVALGFGTQGVATERGMPRDSRELERGMDQLLSTMKVLRNDLVPVLLQMGREFAHEIPLIGRKDIQTWLTDLNRIGARYPYREIGGRMSRIRPLVDPRWPQGAAYAGPALAGERSLIFVNGAVAYVINGESPAEHQAMSLQSSKISVERVQPGRTVVATGAQMDAMSVQEIHHLIGTIEQLLTELESASSERIRRDLLAAGAQVKKLYENQFNNVSTDATQRQTHRGMQWATVYSSWCSQPYVVLLAHAVRVARAACAVASRQMRNYA